MPDQTYLSPAQMTADQQKLANYLARESLARAGARAGAPGAAEKLAEISAEVERLRTITGYTL